MCLFRLVFFLLSGFHRNLVLNECGLTFNFVHYKWAFYSDIIREWDRLTMKQKTNEIMSSEIMLCKFELILGIYF